MNHAKARFFDGQVEAVWSAPPYTPEELVKVRRLLAASALTTGMSVLEPGCGTGRLTRILADAVGPSGGVLALDISVEMTRACRALTQSCANVTVARSSLEDYAFGDTMFDLIICHQVFPHFDDKPSALHIMGDVLRPMGKLLVFHLEGSASINDLHRKVDPAVRGDFLPPEDEQRRLFADAGFSIGLFSDDEVGYLLEAVKTRFSREPR